MLKTILKEELEPIKEDIQSLKSGQSELNQLVRAIHDRQEESDAKIENLTFNVFKLQGEVTSIKETVTDIKDDIEYTYEKTSKNELEIFKLRKEQAK